MIPVERLCKRFGGLVAVNDVSLTIQSGKITGLIGAEWRWQIHAL